MCENQESKKPAVIEELESQLIQTGKMAELGVISASMVHELRQPLLGIKSFAQMILEEIKDEGPLKRRVEQILKQALRMEEMVNRIREFSRQSEAVFGPVSLSEVVREVLDLLSYRLKKFDLKLENRVGPDLPHVLGDFNQLEQVFFNLIDNALDATEGKNPRIVGIKSRAGEKNENLEVYVYDNGMGIPAESRVRLFQPFFTTKDPRKGTGLGLYLSREIIQKHKGSFTLVSPQELGDLIPGGINTVFRVEIPMV